MNKNEKKILSQALGLITEAKEIVEVLKDAREQYYDDRSDKWQEEKGDDYMDESSTIEELFSAIEEVEDQFGQIELD